jgi:hypothetical protein
MLATHDHQHHLRGMESRVWTHAVAQISALRLLVDHRHCE